MVLTRLAAHGRFEEYGLHRTGSLALKLWNSMLLGAVGRLLLYGQGVEHLLEWSYAESGADIHVSSVKIMLLVPTYASPSTA